LYAKKRKISEELEPTIPYTVNPSNYVNHITPETVLSFPFILNFFFF